MTTLSGNNEQLRVFVFKLELNSNTQLKSYWQSYRNLRKRLIKEFHSALEYITLTDDSASGFAE